MNNVMRHLWRIHSRWLPLAMPICSSGCSRHHSTRRYPCQHHLLDSPLLFGGSPSAVQMRAAWPDDPRGDKRELTMVCEGRTAVGAAVAFLRN